MRVVQNLDPHIWRDFVDRNPHSNIFHTPEMFQVFARTRGYESTLWAVIDDRGCGLALLPTVQITILGGLLRGLTTRIVAYGSVLCTPDPQGRAALSMLLAAYTQEMRRMALMTELRNLSDMAGVQSVLVQNGFAYEEHVNFLIDLDRPPSELWQNIRSNARRNIQKARKSGVTVSEVDDPADIPALYALLQQVYHHIQVPLPDQSLFEAAFSVLHPCGMLRILRARIDGVDIGVLTLLIHRGVMIYWYTGTPREYAQHRASDLLVWHALELGSRCGFRLFDFGGGGRPGEEYGVRDFKAKFGGDLVSFGRNTCIHAPLRLRLSTTGYQFMRRFL